MKHNTRTLNKTFGLLVLCWSLTGLGSLYAQDIIHPASGTENITITAGDIRNYYDPGGANGNYEDNQSGTLNVCPATAGEMITLTFSHVDIEASNLSFGEYPGTACCWDGVTISDGNGQLFTGCGEDSGDGHDACSDEGGSNDLNPGATFTSTSTDGCLSIFFQSDVNATETGWEATLSSSGVAPPCAISNLTVTNLRCGDGFNSDDAYADVSFDVVDGSGEYNVRVREVGATGSSNGNSIFNETTSGTVNSTAQLTVGSVEGGDMAEVFVWDSNDNTCVSNIVTVQVPVCPPCPAVGGLVITEIMQDPAEVTDANGEWFEVYNAGPDQINMKNIVISDNGTNTHTIADDLLVNPGEYVVLGRNDNPATNGGVVVDYAYGGAIQLANGDDEIILTCQGTEIDRVEYDGGPDFPDPTGASMQLDPASTDATANDDGSNWCEATTAYGDGDLGTPGNENTGCCTIDLATTISTSVSCVGGSDGSLTITATGATNINFTIDGPGGMQTNTTGVFVDLMAGNFSVTVSDADIANCSVTKTSTVSTASDTEDPMAICPGNIIESNDPGECGAEVTFNIDVSDNCPGATVEADPPSGSFFPVGTTTVTVTATDASGNTDQCTFDVRVNDTEDPMVDCTAEIMVDNDPGLCEATIDLPIPDTSDNCGIVSFEYRFVAVDDANNEIGPFSDWFDVEAGATITLDVGRFRIRFRADDAAGNRGGCNQFVTVTDKEAPLITACAGTTVNFNGEDSFNSADVIDFAAMDNCGIVSTTFDPPLISCEDLGTTVVVTVTVTDAAGNSESCMANVVVDGLPCGFMLAEIGCQGDADYDVPTETFTLEATNCLYGNPFNQDELTYVKTELCGNGEIIAEVDDVEAFAWAGIMMRETLAQGSKKIALSRDNGFYARREARTATNGPAYPQQFPAFGKNWLRLVRQGNQFIGYVSPNGVNWQQVMVANVSMSECIFVGLFLTNKQPNQTVTADFRNVEVNEAGGLSLQQLPTTDPSEIGTISVYPNPTAGPVTVDLGAMLDKEVQLELRNTNGQLLRQLDLGRVSERRTELQLGDLPTGIYWLRIEAGGQAPITKRIVVQRP